MTQLMLVIITLNSSALLYDMPTKSCLFTCNIVVYIVRNIVHERKLEKFAYNPIKLKFRSFYE
jgi:hypothetical protein